MQLTTEPIHRSQNTIRIYATHVCSSTGNAYTNRTGLTKIDSNHWQSYKFEHEGHPDMKDHLHNLINRDLILPVN